MPERVGKREMRERERKKIEFEITKKNKKHKSWNKQRENGFEYRVENKTVWTEDRERDIKKCVCVCVCVLEMHFLVREQNKKLSCKKHLDSCALRSKKMLQLPKPKITKLKSKVPGLQKRW